MSGSASQWAAAERIGLAEHERYGDGEARYDPVFKRYRSVRAIEDPDYNITEKTMSADRRSARILRVIEEALGSTTHADIESRAQDLAHIVMAGSANTWYGAYCEVITWIISAAKAVDGPAASEILATLISTLASRGDLVNPSSGDLTYDIGDFWVRPVTIGAHAVLTGEDGLRIWSEMPSLQLWIKEQLERFPRSSELFDVNEKWPDRTWENFTRFCHQLSDIYIQGVSPVSSMWASHALKILHLDLESSSGSRKALRCVEAAIYIDCFGKEIYEFCQNEFQPDLALRSKTQDSGSFEEHDNTDWSSSQAAFSLERWNIWLNAFKACAKNSSQPISKSKAATAVEQMQRIEDIYADWPP